MNARTRGLLVCTLGLCLGFDWPGQASRLAANLDSAGPRERREIVRLLAAQSSDEARPAILKACGDADVGVRQEALRAAGKIGAREATKILLGALSDPDPALRATAAEALGALAVPEATQFLLRALADSEASVRRAAVGALAKLPLDANLPALITALDDADTEVRVEAVRNLAAASSERARDALLGKTRDVAPEVRVAALDAVAKSGDPRAVLALSQALDDGADSVVLAALRGLRALPGIDASALVDPLTRSPRARIAAAAKLSLEQIEQSKVRASSSSSSTPSTDWLSWLERTAKATRDDARIVTGLEATLKEGETLAFDPLRLYLPQTPNGLRARVVSLIGRTHAPAAQPLLVNLIDDKNPEVRAAAAHALAQVGKPEIVGHLLPLLADASFEVRAAATHAIGGIADLGAFRRLLERASSEMTSAQRAALLGALANGVRRLRPQLSESDRSRLLGLLRTETARADKASAHEAVRALGELGDGPAVSVLSVVAERVHPSLRVSIVRALLRADPATALPLLRTLAHAPEVAVRATAVAALGLVGDGRELPAIQKARREGPWPLGPVGAFALASLVVRDQVKSDVLCDMLVEKEPLTRENARAGLTTRPSTRCAVSAPDEVSEALVTHEPRSSTWRALVLTDHRVLISPADAIGKVTLSGVDTLRTESPWRKPYGVR